MLQNLLGVVVEGGALGMPVLPHESKAQEERPLVPPPLGELGPQARPVAPGRVQALGDPLVVEKVKQVFEVLVGADAAPDGREFTERP